uniref:exodeoxyribonuclease III n=1 Tax=Astatotilapia calliptera TaxID=8154 RepID=A0AAX7UZH8_ASTCA
MAAMLTLLVKGLNRPVKRNKVLSHLLYLQETHLKHTDHARLRRNWVGQIFHSKFNGKARGAAILINKNTPFIVSHTIADPNGRYIVVTGSLFNTSLILANVYAPNWNDSTFFNDFLNSLPQINTHQLILGGDMNTVMDPVLDRSSDKRLPLPKSSLVLQSYLQTY